MELVRFPDWPQRLYRAIEARRETPYAWGQNDCALFAAALIWAETGQDFGQPFRGAYADEASAQRMLEAHGWKDLTAMADALLPRRSERPRRGDAVLMEGRFGPFLGILWQGGVIGPGPTRPIIWPARGVIACWSVG
jgi:hypothetical protein